MLWRVLVVSGLKNEATNKSRSSSSSNIALAFLNYGIATPRNTLHAQPLSKNAVQSARRITLSPCMQTVADTTKTRHSYTLIALLLML